MEVHAHAHTARKKWTHYFWEFFMLFLAVTLGFFVENQREHYIENLRAAKYARSLAADLARDTANLTYIVDRIHLQIKNTDSLAAIVKRNRISEVRNIDLFAFTLIDRYPAYRWSRSTLEQIKNSGSLRYFHDSVVRLISVYDALSRHMDEDHRNDEEMANRATSSRDKIVDMSYPDNLASGLYLHFDSLINSAAYRDLAARDKTPLLNSDSINIKIFLNEKLNIKRNLEIRADTELRTLINQARRLISLLKDKYHLK
jgi:hypothetical protein